jgi:mRNA interferase MazF
MGTLKRGDVWWVDFDTAQHGEIQKRRPAVIISNDAANASLNRVQIVPLTSKTDRVYPCEALITFNNDQRKAMADQITTCAKERMKDKIGVVSPEDMKAIEKAVKIQLGLKL